MIWCKYNFLFKSSKYGNLLYNSLSNTFVKFDDETYTQVAKLKDNPQELDIINNMGLYMQLSAGGFLVESNEDLISELKTTRRIANFSSKKAYITIAPTNSCNFRCPYCFEQTKEDIFMSENTQQNVITFLKRSRVDKFDITWYGGEPLLAWDIIKSITQRLIEQNIDFSAGMITNAYEFDNKKISELDNLRIKDIQITIDGLKETHNKKRPHRNGSGTFDRIIENIQKLMDNWQGFINIRVNVDKNNIEEYIALSKYLTSLPFFDKKRIRIHPGIITDFTKDCSNTSSCLLNNSQVADFMFRAYQEHNITDFDFYPEKMYESCTATSLNDYVIDAFGDLYKCWCNVGDKEKSVGNINDSSKLNFKLISRFLSELEPFDDPKCKNCFFLPLCNGGCAYVNYQNRYEGKKLNNCCLWKEDIKTFLEFAYQKKLSDKA